MTKPRTRFPAVLTIFTAISFVILIALGGWQLQRLSWKQSLLTHIEALKTAPTQPLAAVLVRDGDLDMVRVQVTCPGIAAAPFLELYGLRDGQAGARLISACPSGDAAHPTILVDRGFVGDTISARPPVDAANAAPVVVTGILRLPDKASFVTPPNDVAANRWFSRDIAAMAVALKAPTPAAPVYLMAESATNPEWPDLVPAPIPAEISNRHLEYALTWFGLAAALVGVYAAVLFRWRKS